MRDFADPYKMMIRYVRPCLSIDVMVYNKYCTDEPEKKYFFADYDAFVTIRGKK